MVGQQRPARPWAHALLAALLWKSARAQGPSVPIAYCASINTAVTPANNSIYQSDGLCSGFCWDKGYSLAIVQTDTCWCSDDVPDPSDQVSVGQCDEQCPGYPTDLCGAKGLFGYMQDQAIQPSGTAAGPSGAGVSSAAASSAPPSSSSSSPVGGTGLWVQFSFSVEVETETQQTVSSPTTSSSSQSSSSTTSSETSTSPGASTTASQPAMRTVTVGGSVMTVTATPTADTDPSNIKSSNNGLAGGAIAGIVIGILAVIGGILFLLFFLWRRRRQADAGDGPFEPGSKRGSSSAGMSGTPKAGEMENRYVMGPEGRTMAENWENPQSMKRRSALMPVDPRLDPKGIYNGAPAGNKSRESIGSLQDNADYSRRVYEPPKVLRAINPDPVAVE